MIGAIHYLTPISFATAACISLLFFGTTAVLALDDSWYFGIGTALHTNTATVNFVELQGIPKPPEAGPFNAGDGRGFSVHAWAAMPLGDNWQVGARASVVNSSDEATASESIPIAGDGVGDIAEVRHAIAVDRTAVTLRAFGQRHLFADLWAGIGVTFGPVFVRKFEQSETIVDPEDVDFLDGGEREIIAAGDLPKASSVIFGARSFLAYPIRLDRRLAVVPEIAFDFDFTAPATDISWNITSLSFGVSLAYIFGTDTVSEDAAPLDIPDRPDAPPDIEISIIRDTTTQLIPGLLSENVYHKSSDTVDSYSAAGNLAKLSRVIRERYIREMPQALPVLDGALDVRFVTHTQQGIELRSVEIIVPERLHRTNVPILPYIFFDDNSAAIPDRYGALNPDQTSKFDENAFLSSDPLTIYYRALDIVGARLRRHSNAQLEITGCNGDRDAEHSNLDISIRRAEAVRNYLRDIWKIRPERLSVLSRNLPDLPSPPNTSFGFEENSRVELFSYDPAIFAPVSVTNTIRNHDPLDIRFYPQVFSEAGCRNWKVRVVSDSNNLFEKSGEGKPPERFDWRLNRDRPPELLLGADLVCILSVVDETGQHFEAPPAKLTFRYNGIDTVDSAIPDQEHYSLVRFAYNNAELIPAHAGILKTIKQRIRKETSVVIVGATDSVGDTENNRQLSLQRAHTVEQALGISYAKIRAIDEANGADRLRYPEERMYSRRVDIILSP